MTTLICVPVMVDEIHVALADAAEAHARGADLVEFRVDAIFHGEGDSDGIAAVARLVEESPLPCIVTCRPAWEGGLYDGDDAARVALFEHLATLDRPPRYIDVEHAAFTRSANLRQKVRLAVSHPMQQRDLRTTLILSRHDFDGRPGNLNRTLADMRSDDTAGVTKLAWNARSIRDNLELFEILAERDRPTIALAMGRFGLMSRLLAPKLGGFLTFASLRDSAATAPGQPTIDELTGLYRFRAIHPGTRVYGIIGWPVEHSLSPALHNAGFHAAGHDGVYLPMPVPPEWEHFKATLLAFTSDPRLDFRGASVTIPHKTHLVRLAHEQGWTVDPVADRAGAANTITIDDTSAVTVTNTDVGAVTGALTAAGVEVRDARVTILGAGGVARAAAVAMLDAGARVTIAARTLEQARRLAGEVDTAVTVLPWEQRPGDADLVINATPVGMTRHDDPGAAHRAPLDPDHLDRLCARRNEAPVIFDTVYNPTDTALLRLARSRGLRTVAGSAMFVHQAAAQFAQWPGADQAHLPLALFERIVAETSRK